MKFVTYTSQHIPCWSILKGDHALKTNIEKYIKSDHLLDSPDFSSSLENNLRETILKNTRGRRWVWKHLYENNPGISIVEIEDKDWKNVKLVWKDMTLMDAVNDYEFSKSNENKSFLEMGPLDERKRKANVSDLNYILELKKTKVATIKENQDITKQLLNKDKSYDFHRTIWLKSYKDNSYTIIDGTHRNIAMAWKVLKDKKPFKHKIYAFMINETNS